DRLQMRARLAELDADALDIADAEPFPDERVDIDSAGEHVPARLGRRELDSGLLDECLHAFGGDEGDRAARRRVPAGEVVPVADEALARHGAHALDRLRHFAVCVREEDPFDASLDHRETLAAEPAAAARLDRDDVVSLQVERHLARERLAVQGVPPGRARLAAALALGRAPPPLGADRAPARLER